MLSHTVRPNGSARGPKTPQQTMATQAGSLVVSAMDAAAALGKLPRATIAAGLLGLLTAAFSARVAYRWYRLSHIPGPFWASFSSLWMVKVTLEGRAPEAWKEATDKYGAAGPFPVFLRRMLTVIGSLARVGPNDLVTDDPDVLRRMMAVRSPYSRGPCTFHTQLDSSPVRKYRTDAFAGYGAQRLDPARDNLISTRDEVAHRELRAKMAAGVSCHPA